MKYNRKINLSFSIISFILAAFFFGKSMDYWDLVYYYNKYQCVPYDTTIIYLAILFSVLFLGFLIVACYYLVISFKKDV